MKVIKTYWYNPKRPDTQPFYTKIRREPLYLFSLSSLLLLQYYPVELYTDEEGAKQILPLNIPFSKVHIVDKPGQAYKSVNDLHVLSMQDEPAVLVDDNLLAMGKTAFRCPPNGITVLGIDLNSLKLVKALIKTKRIEEHIPFLDDTVFLNKTSFVDASLLISNNNTLLKEYVELATGFIHRHSEALAQIEPVVAEDFFRRYWLYTFCREKGVIIDSFYKNPLEVVHSQWDEFCFSQKNIVQDFLKVMDHHYGDALFTVHFFCYFKRQFSVHLSAVEQAVAKPAGMRVKIDPYVRTRYAYNALYAQHNSSTTPKKRGRPSLQEIKNQLATGPDTRSSGLVADILHYEATLNQVRKHYFKNSTVVLLQEQKAFDSMLRWWNVPRLKIEQLPLLINPYFFFVETGWKWSTRWVDGVSGPRTGSLKVIYNLHLDQAYYITAFMPDTERNSAYEFNLDKLSAQIIDFFEKENTIAQFYGNVVPPETDPAGAQELKDAYYNRIKELLLINILCINEP